MKWWLAIVVALALQQPRPTTVQVVFDTELGRFTVEVDAAHAPITAANFLKYVDDGLYDGGPGATPRRFPLSARTRPG